MKKGLVHIYTGNGKGKTTAAIGCALRAVGQGFKVAIFQFLKGGGLDSGEIKALKVKRNCKAVRFKQVHPCFQKNKKDIKCSNLLKKRIKQDFTKAKSEIFSKKYDVVILDEIIVAVRDGYISEAELIDLIDEKPLGVELLLTGRGATKDLIAWADYVTAMHPAKHPYSKKVPPRKGIEF